jgi:hypothetical protein
MATITLPHNFKPRKYQLPFLKAFDSGIKRFILVWHRRSGKDKTVFSHVPKKMFERVGTYFYFLPTYTQAKKVIWTGADKDGFRFLDHIPKDIIKGEPNETEMRIELVNGSILQMVGADNIDRIVGTNPVGVIFSEYSLMKPKVWEYIRPILAENGGWAIFVFTPRGMNHAWTLMQMALQDTLNWFVQVLGVNDTKAIPELVLEQEQKEMPQDLFEQEYHCKFIEGAGQFFKRISHNLCEEMDKPEPNHKYQMGVDLAKYQDYTVITVIDLNTFKVHKQERFNQIDWNLQKAKIEAMYLRYGRPLIYMDSTGVGDPIYEDLSKMGLRIEGYKFNENSRKDLLINLSLLLEQGKIKIPDSQNLKDELASFKYELTESGRTKIVAPEGLHDDCVFSLALACWNLPDNPIPLPGSVRFLNTSIQRNAPQTSYE